ncbi:fungal specific transcription factor domain-containing protein [Cordyceps javanica]|uniref:Fungal specific transcription factor domain-containing protein n=1 Tax=Cordyceps javanica TaxID=43265 RepID=A0A545V174_9HYPO|nr:fungal specific transcription factor domain-containing protein [Cordyceps javanica]
MSEAGGRIEAAATSDPATSAENARSYAAKPLQPSMAAMPVATPYVDMDSFAWDDDAFINMEAFPNGLHQTETTPSCPILPAETPPCAAAHDPVQSDAFLLGPSSDPDPFFRGRYAFDDHGAYQATLRRYQRASETGHELFAITPHHRVSSMADATTALPIEPLAEELLPFAPRLYQLFAKFVYPIFPLPVGDSWRAGSSTLSSAVCATALSWRSHDTTLPWAPFETATVATEIPAPDANRLYRFAWACISREMHAPSYETIQAALLLIERRTPLTDLCDSPFNSCISACITSMAFSLGLNRSADSWSIHTESQKQRRRLLWWLVFVEDKWTSAATGKPASIRDGEYDVATPAFTFTGSLAEIQFEYLLYLTFILQDILNTVMHWRFWTQPSIDISDTLSKVRAFETRLQFWRNSVNDNQVFLSDREPEGSAYGVLIVAYLYCHVLLQKALLRATRGRSHSHFNAFSEFLPYLISLAPTAQDQASARESASKLRQWLFAHGKYIDLVRVAMSRLDLCLAAVDAGRVRLCSDTTNVHS